MVDVEVFSEEGCNCFGGVGYRRQFSVPLRIVGMNEDTDTLNFVSFCKKCNYCKDRFTFDIQFCTLSTEH